MTKSRTIRFCCPGFEEYDTKEKKICIKNGTLANSSKLNNINVTTEKNPYLNYSGEYGREFNHYLKMGLNESDAQQSVNKLVEYEIKKAKEEFEPDILDDTDSYIFVDVSGNAIHAIEPLKHPQFVTDHHSVAHHEEVIAMVKIII